MPRNQTSDQITKRRRRRIAGLAVAVMAAALIGLGINVTESGLREQGGVSLRNAILDSAKQCCAIEGSYPPSLSYLEQNYGLVVNRNDYTITYETFADNVMPNVVVSAK